MSTGRTIAIVVGGCLLIALIMFAPWPAWVSVILALPVAAVMTLLVVHRPAAIPERVSEPFPVLPPEPGCERTELSDVLLPSSRHDYHFRFSATVVWSAMTATVDASVLNLGALAVDFILQRAQQITVHMDPERVTLVQHELASALGRTRPDGTGYVRAMAESVRLALSDGDHERLEKLAAVRKEKDVWEHERTYEQNKRAYLSNDVLRDPGSTVVWWLARNDDQVKKTVDDIGLLSQLFSAANNGRPSRIFQGLTQPMDDYAAADHFAEFLRKAGFSDDDPATALYVERVADITGVHNRGEVAEELRHRFDVPAADEDQAGDDGSDDPLPFGSDKDEPGDTPV